MLWFGIKPMRITSFHFLLFISTSLHMNYAESPLITQEVHTFALFSEEVMTPRRNFCDRRSWQIPCLLMLLIDCQIAHMCLRQLCSDLWGRWNQKVSLTEWVTGPHIGLMSWTAKKDLFVNIREDSIQGELPPVHMKCRLLLFLGRKKTTGDAALLAEKYHLSSILWVPLYGRCVALIMWKQ